MKTLMVLALSCMTLVVLPSCAANVNTTEMVTKAEYDELMVKYTVAQDEIILLSSKLSATPTPTPSPEPTATNTPSPTPTATPTPTTPPKPEDYETGITYEQLARNPDEYSGNKVKFTGVVLQVMEDKGTVGLRVATANRYDDVIFAIYPSDLVTSRILEDDKITVYGISGGLYTYKSTGSGYISIPLVTADIIDR